MDQQFKKLLTRRNIFIALGLVIVLEIIWAGSTLFKEAAKPSPTIPAQTVAHKPTAVSLSTSKTQLKVGEKLTVSINLSSDKKTDGTDLIITFDPKLLSVETVAQSKSPVIAGNIYSDYPLNSLDQTGGRITVSGITDTPSGVLADGLFGSIVIVGKAPGFTKISLEFSPGSTADSNVTESGTGKDVLEKVSDLEVNISP